MEILTLEQLNSLIVNMTNFSPNANKKMRLKIFNKLKNRKN